MRAIISNEVRRLSRRYLQRIEKPPRNCDLRSNFAGVPAMDHNLRRAGALSLSWIVLGDPNANPVREIVAPIVSAGPVKPGNFFLRETFQFSVFPGRRFCRTAWSPTIDGSAMLCFLERSVNNASLSIVTGSRKPGISWQQRFHQHLLQLSS